MNLWILSTTTVSAISAWTASVQPGMIVRMQGDTTMSILSRLIDPSAPTLSRGAAEAVLKMEFCDSDQQRIMELASKSNQGALTREEASEYDSYIAAADFLALLKSKARLSLKQRPSAA